MYCAAAARIYSAVEQPKDDRVDDRNKVVMVQRSGANMLSCTVETSNNELMNTAMTRRILSVLG